MFHCSSSRPTLSTTDWAGGPLAGQGEEFPLGPATWWWEGAEDAPSLDASVRPFSLRGVREGPRLDTPPGYRYVYDPRSQTATVHDQDGAVTALARHTQPGATPAATSGSADGDPKNPPPEEMGSPDYQTD